SEAQERLRGQIDLPAFAEAVASAWEGGRYHQRRPPSAAGDLPAEDLEPEEDAVQVVEAFDARQQEFDAVFLMGLNEQVFPRATTDNPFLRDDERLALAQQGVELERAVERADEERVLFYRALTAPSRQLILSFSRTDADGRPALVSYYLDEVRAAFADDGPPTVVRTLADVVPPVPEAVGTREKALCAAAALAGHRPLPEEELKALLCQLAAEKPAVFTDFEAFARTRPDYQVRGCALRQRLASLSGTRVFGVSELETFIACPHQHFLRYQLGLRKVTEETQALDLGLLLHEVLRRFLDGCRGKADLPPAADAAMEAILEEQLQNFVRDARPWRVHMTRHLARECLARFLQRERDYRVQTGLSPGWLELTFGPGMIHRHPYADPASSNEPLVIAEGDDEVRLVGAIDRVDFVAESTAVVVIDYKLSGGTSLREMVEGKNLQMPVYLLALERLFGKQVAALVHYPLRKGELYWVYRPDVAPQLRPGRADGLPRPHCDGLVETVQQAVLNAARGIRAAESRPAPDSKRCESCDLQDVCRPEEYELAQS
ncbi:MAG: PD-(D/E)XK nuclease family protein, partial [Armatimonadota bacterium]|nr:PD-(D/E)XK nuclease family protein [Armatimonadota bacterium]